MACNFSLTYIVAKCILECMPTTNPKKSIHLVCKHCDKTFKVFNCYKNSYTYCSKKCRYDATIGNITICRRKGKSPYQYIHLGIGIRKLDHRHIMEQHLGRTLNKKELIHHVDGNSLNNVIENLEIIDRAKHTAIHRAIQLSKTN